MSNSQESFEDLLAAAPLADEDVVLIGTLGRVANSDNFLLFLPDGRSITLDVNAVKRHQVVAHSTGRPVVRLTIDSAKVPTDVMQSEGVRANLATNTVAYGDPIKIVWMDPHHPSGPSDLPKGGPESSNTGTYDQTSGTKPGYDAPYGSGHTGGWLPEIISPTAWSVPFGLLTPHQSAEAAAMAMLGRGWQP